jgi:hypothetical protein
MHIVVPLPDNLLIASLISIPDISRKEVLKRVPFSAVVSTKLIKTECLLHLQMSNGFSLANSRHPHYNHNDNMYPIKKCN